MTIPISGIAYRDAMRRRAATMLGLALVAIALGLSLRLFGRGLGWPAVIVKYGGSVLWATMVLFLVATLRPRLSRPRLALIAIAVAAIVELIRLLHTPWLDDFRLTLAGALLLGRIFSLWNLVAYAAGIALGVAVDWAMGPVAVEDSWERRDRNHREGNHKKDRRPGEPITKGACR